MNKYTLIILIVAPMLFLWACGNQAPTDNTETDTAPTIAATFQAKCSMCHAFKEDKIGPALSGVLERWKGDRGQLKSFIRNAQAFIESGDPYSVQLYKKWHKAAMPSFSGMSDAELDALIDYLAE